MPFNVSIKKYAQYLHPEKRNIPVATNAISSLALKITTVVENLRDSSWKVRGRIRNQWMIYRNEDIPERYYASEHGFKNKAAVQEPYWDCTLELCALHPKVSSSSGHKRTDYDWLDVYKIYDKNDLKKYPQLFSLGKCVLTLNHGNSAPERGFSINKIMFDAGGYSI